MAMFAFTIMGCITAASGHLHVLQSLSPHGQSVQVREAEGKARELANDLKTLQDKCDAVRKAIEGKQGLTFVKRYATAGLDAVAVISLVVEGVKVAYPGCGECVEILSTVLPMVGAGLFGAMGATWSGGATRQNAYQ